MSQPRVRLHEHVLYLIAEQVIAALDQTPPTVYRAYHRQTIKETLCNLRLTCKDFADMGIIKANLFRSIEFKATYDQIARLQQTNFASLGSFVEIITFTQSPYSMIVTSEQFKNLLLVRLFHLVDSGRGRLGPDSLFEAQSHLKHHWRGRFPMPDREIEALFKIYQGFARDDEKIISDGQLQKLWVSALTLFQKPVQVNISAVRNCLPHTQDSDDCEYYLDYCGRTAVRCGDLLFRAVTYCLASTRIPVVALDIDCPLSSTLQEGWTSIEWATLDLSQCARLQIEENFAGLVSESGSKGTLWTSMLRKGQRSLQHVRIGNPHGFLDMKMATFAGLSFPLLHDLALEGISFDGLSLASALERSPALQQLSLCRCAPDEDGEGWKAVFDTIRKHAGPLTVDLSEVMFGEDADWDFSFAKNQAGSADRFTHQGYDMEADLFKYLCDRGPWTAHLSDWLSW